MNDDQLMTEHEFVGGPLEGPNMVHPMQNSLMLKVEGYTNGYYRMYPELLDLKFYWTVLREGEQLP